MADLYQMSKNATNLTDLQANMPKTSTVTLNDRPQSKGGPHCSQNTLVPKQIPDPQPQRNRTLHDSTRVVRLAPDEAKVQIKAIKKMGGVRDSDQITSAPETTLHEYSIQFNF